MAKNTDNMGLEVKSKKMKRMDIVIFIVLTIGAVAMVFPLVYMVCASFMTKGQILSGHFSLIPNPLKTGTYKEVLFEILEEYYNEKSNINETA